jgi:hypothetical protein
MDKSTARPAGAANVCTLQIELGVTIFALNANWSRTHALPDACITAHEAVNPISKIYTPDAGESTTTGDNK